MRVAKSSRPQVLNASTSASATSSEPLPDGDLSSPSHQDERQIVLDTDRSFVHYPSGEAPSSIPHSRLAQRASRNAHTESISFVGESDAVKEEMKTKLNELIVSIFRKRPTLNYYQVQVLLF
jgi:hypothetical protein